ncbi:MAG: hypothetical protein ABIS38_02545, partial [Sphingomicrobium sp.]
MMLAYAAKAHVFAARRPSPQAMLLIVAGHVALIAVVMSAKMDLPARIQRTITRIDMIPLPAPPPPEPTRQAPAKPAQSVIDRQPVIVPTSRPPADPIDAGPNVIPEPGGAIAPPFDTGPVVELPPDSIAVRLGPRLATPPSALRPPYPSSKLAREEEAVLRLRLTIDARGRVTAVDPVGRFDPAFIDAARRHLIARWRYL